MDCKDLFSMLGFPYTDYAEVVRLRSGGEAIKDILLYIRKINQCILAGSQPTLSQF